MTLIRGKLALALTSLILAGALVAQPRNATSASATTAGASLPCSGARMADSYGFAVAAPRGMGSAQATADASMAKDLALRYPGAVAAERADAVFASKAAPELDSLAGTMLTFKSDTLVPIPGPAGIDMGLHRVSCAVAFYDANGEFVSSFAELVPAGE
jgi:hypothetical protein